MMCGGLGETKSADSNVQQICDKVREDVQAKAGRPFSKFEACHFASQVVAGTNYFIKVDVGDSFIHIRVYKTLPHAGSTLEVSAIQIGKTRDDPILYFE